MRNSTATANSLEILATPTGGVQQQAVVAKSDSRVQTLGTASGATTYRIFGAASSFNFQNVASSSGSSGGSGEGESAEGEGEAASTVSATLAATADATVHDELIAQLDAGTDSMAASSTASSSSTSSGGASLLDFLARRRSTSTYADAIDAILGE